MSSAGTLPSPGGGRCPQGGWGMSKTDIGRVEASPIRRAMRATFPLRGKVILMFLLALLAAPAFAVEPDEVLPDKALEQRARAISAEIRCVVCQNQSIDDSNAEIARDMRRAIRERLTKGDSDAAVVAFLRARYGDYVLLRPPFDPRTWLLWLGGPLLLLLAGRLLYRGAKRRAAQIKTAPAELTAAERRRLDALLRDDEGGRR